MWWPVLRSRKAAVVASFCIPVDDGGAVKPRWPGDRSAPHRRGKRLKWSQMGGISVSEVVASQVSVRDLKTHLSEWLGRVQAGEVVEVTSHRKPIARITAVNPAESTSSSPLQKAIDAGLISWNGQKPNLPPPVKLRGKGRLLSEIVIEDRG